MSVAVGRGVSAMPGVRIGHWTDAAARTGCTVVRFPEGTVASGEVRGGAPATREVALLDPVRTVERLDALVLTGGSAFGLAAADGVVQRLEADGVGFATGFGVVPIVVALGLFDLGVGDASIRPDAASGAAAFDDARPDARELGAVGAGAGCTIGKWLGRDHSTPAGLGAATADEGGVTVAALVALNAVGWLDDGSDRTLARSGDRPDGRAFGNTTIGVIVTDAPLTKVQCHLVAQSGHDGLARALVPSHTHLDGDALVAASVPRVAALADEVDLGLVRALATQAVEAAIRAAAP